MGRQRIKREIMGGGGEGLIKKRRDDNWRKSGERGLGGVGGYSQSDVANHPACSV